MFGNGTSKVPANNGTRSAIPEHLFRHSASLLAMVPGKNLKLPYYLSKEILKAMQFKKHNNLILKVIEWFLTFPKKPAFENGFFYLWAHVCTRDKSIDFIVWS